MLTRRLPALLLRVAGLIAPAAVQGLDLLSAATATEQGISAMSARAATAAVGAPDWIKCRNDTPGCKHVVHFNNAGELNQLPDALLPANQPCMHLSYHRRWCQAGNPVLKCAGHDPFTQSAPYSF
jgi:hypothetical protein